MTARMTRVMTMQPATWRSLHLGIIVVVPLLLAEMMQPFLEGHLLRCQSLAHHLPLREGAVTPRLMRPAVAEMLQLPAGSTITPQVRNQWSSWKQMARDELHEWQARSRAPDASGTAQTAATAAPMTTTRTTRTTSVTFEVRMERQTPLTVAPGLKPLSFWRDPAYATPRIGFVLCTDKRCRTRRQMKDAASHRGPLLRKWAPCAAEPPQQPGLRYKHWRGVASQAHEPGSGRPKNTRPLMNADLEETGTEADPEAEPLPPEVLLLQPSLPSWSTKQPGSLTRVTYSLPHHRHKSPLVGCAAPPAKTLAYWRPRLLRAEAFQRPRRLLLKRTRRVARWVLGLPQLSQCRAWQRSRGCTGSSSRTYTAAYAGGPPLLPALPILKAHNLSSPPYTPRHQAHTAHHTTHKSRGRPGPNAGSKGGPALRLARGAGKPSGTVQQGRERTFTQAIKRSYRASLRIRSGRHLVQRKVAHTCRS